MSNHVEAGQNTTSLCPTCGEMSEFTNIGTQKWPEKVAQAMQMPTETALYCCGSCHTTINEMTLFDSKIV